MKNTWVEADGKKYYIGADSYAYKGSRNVHGKFYLFESKKGYAFTNRKRIGTERLKAWKPSEDYIRKPEKKALSSGFRRRGSFVDRKCYIFG